MEKLPKIGLPILVGVIVLVILLAKSLVTIGPGEGGVLFEPLGNGINTERTYGEGFHIVAPWNDMIVQKVRQRELLSPAINAAAKSVVGRYTPEQLYSSKRDIIELEILEQVRVELEGQYVNVKRVLVENVKLPTTIKDAIERKLKQEQESLEYEFRLVTAKKEAEKVIIEAQGKADANRILSASLTDKILQDKGIEATVKLSESSNSKVIVIGSGDSGMPIILGNQ